MAAIDEVRTINGYKIGRTLGTGMSAKVKLGVRASDGQQAALKLIDRSKLGARQQEMLEREIRAMQSLEHPNILHLQDVVFEANYPKKRGGHRQVVLLALELGTGGELFDYLMHTGAFSEVVARTYFRQLLSALEVCHAQGVFHRDLKPENLLLDGNFQLKLADFGLAAISLDDQMCVTECGTRSYMAPEVMSRRPYDGAKADIWSAGVVLFIMLAGNPPFAQAAGNDWWFNAISKKRHDRFWAAHLRSAPDFPKAAQEFLNKIFVANADERASIDNLWEDPWLQGATLQPGELAEAMAAKHRRVEQQKNRELAAAKAQKAHAGKTDPFSKRTMRAAGDHPPPKIDDGERFTCFYTHADPAAVMSKVSEVFAAKGATDTKQTVEDYKFKTTIARESGPLTVAVRLYTTQEDDDLFVLDFQRRIGDHLDFLKLVSTELRQDLQEVIADSADAPDVPEQPSEEPIADEAAEQVF